MKHFWWNDDDFIFSRKNGSNEGDIFVGTTGNDVYHGRGGSDSLLGNWGNDRLWGDAGNDAVTGGGGNDRLFGGSGNDRISGEGGTDIMTGGRGLDTFYYTANGNLLPGAGHGFDRITDFDPSGQDHDDIVMLINSGFGVSTFADLRRGMRMDHGDTVMNFGGGDILVLENVRIGQLHGDDFLIIPA
jgi:Ca2+-binding RTX toxin-like protein